MKNVKKVFVAPKVTRVINGNLMAGKCNDTFIYTSAGGVTSDGYANVCYHFPKVDKIGDYTIIAISSNNAGGNGYSTQVVNLPKGCTFVTPERNGQWREGNTQYSITTEIGLGWQDFEGTNGNCHFVGFIYYQGQLIDREVVKSGYIGTHRLY